MQLTRHIAFQSGDMILDQNIEIKTNFEKIKNCSNNSTYRNGYSKVRNDIKKFKN